MSLELIKKIREITGAGIGDVKEALDEAGGNEEKAIEILRKAGQKIAAKKAERTTNEGVIAVASEAGKVAVVGLACETDFVAKNPDFVKAVDDFAAKLLTEGEAGFAEWADAEIKNNLIVKIGENLKLGEFAVIEGETLGSYLHSNKKIAVVVSLSGGDENLAKEVAMQAAAMNPSYLKPEDVPVEVLEKEKEIYAEQLKKEGKPEEMIEKISAGKLQKFYSEACLLKQAYIKDDKMSIEQLLGDAEIKEYRRFSL